MGTDSTVLISLALRTAQGYEHDQWGAHGAKRSNALASPTASRTAHIVVVQRRPTRLQFRI